MTRIRITQFRFFLVCILSSAIIQLLMTPLLLAQATAWTGGIQGTILDPSGGVIPNAKVQITGKSTGQKLAPPLTAAGIYDSGPLTPGDYLVRVEAEGFKTVEETLTVQVGVVSSGNVTLQVGTSATVVTVDASSVRVNTEQATLFGILTTQQIENLPINGRNSLDLAQLEPGVQIQDGGNFDPTKLGFSSISFGGRFGRAARVEADGLDVSDEGVGTTTTNIPLSALQEFQVSQSMLDLSTELTSTGAVNMVTRSGTNDYHGQAFYTIRDHNLAAALPGPPAPFQRHQFGGNFGGPLLKDRLLLFAAGEGTKQDLFAPVPLEEPFQAFSGGFNSPYREGNLVGRLDWQANSNLKMFCRFSYFQSRAVSTYGFGAVSYSPFNSRNWNRAHAVGADFTTGKFIHSLRLGYLNYVNNITDAVRGSGLPLADFPLSLSIGSLSTGPNFLASQSTTQQGSLQLKYDSSRIRGSHILRYGVTYNRVLGYGFAAFCAMAPIAQTSLGVSEEAFASTNPFGPGGGGNPLNYPVELVFVGNGLGYFSEIPTFGYPAGGFGPDHRLGIYVGDTWKIRANFTLSYGLRYVRDTGRSDSDLPPIPELNAVLPGFGNRIHQPNSDFAPQLGVAYDPWKSGKTVIRAGLGLFYENSVWNNVMFDRPARLSTGAFGTVSVACNAGVPQMVVFADGSTRPPPAGACSTAEGAPVPLGQAAPLLEQFSQEFQQVAASVGTNAVNPNYVPSLIAAGFPLGGSWSTLYDPQYQSPRSVEMNLGVQRELWKGSVVSVDFLRNVGTHYLLGMDVNHAGDARYLNREAARLAISATNGAFNCGTGSDAASIPCAIQAGATIGDYAGHGLTSPADFGVANCDLTLGFPCAFAGQDRAMGSAYFLQPIHCMSSSYTIQPFPGVSSIISTFRSPTRFRVLSMPGSKEPAQPGLQIPMIRTWALLRMRSTMPSRSATWGPRLWTGPTSSPWAVLCSSLSRFR
jgi:hypothetical protein